MKSTLDLNKELHKKLSRIKAPIVLPAGKTPGYQGACVFCREDGYHLISSSKAEGHQTLCISRSRDLTGWSAPAPLWEDEREEGQGIPGSGVFFQGNYLFCSLSKKSLHLISSQDLNEFVSLGELLLSGDHASLAKACRAGSAVSSEETLLPEARGSSLSSPPVPSCPCRRYPKSKTPLVPLSGQVSGTGICMDRGSENMAQGRTDRCPGRFRKHSPASVRLCPLYHFPGKKRNYPSIYGRQLRAPFPDSHIRQPGHPPLPQQMPGSRLRIL